MGGYSYLLLNIALRAGLLRIRLRHDQAFYLRLLAEQLLLDGAGPGMVAVAGVHELLA